MIDSYDFLKEILNSLTEHIVVINKQGEIVFFNQSWRSFASDNEATIEEWCGINYVSECEKAANMGDEVGEAVGLGIKDVIASRQQSFYYEYPCHSPDEKRWFMMRVLPLDVKVGAHFIISHQNITERKVAEERVRELSRIDGLTQIANRRHFDVFLKREWRRCHRLALPFSMAVLDIDHFKLLNDTYGHQVGDEALVQVARVLKNFVKRPSDLCARYGGEEFALIWGGLTGSEANSLAGELLERIEKLSIPNKHAPTKPTLTCSIGVVTITPESNDETWIFGKADDLLYQAKEQGRNRVISLDVGAKNPI